MEQIASILITSSLCGMLAHALSSMEIRRIRRKEGVKADGPLIQGLDLFIIMLISALMQVGALDGGPEVMAIAGAFGAFLAAAAWSDAKTGWVPDSSIISALVFGALSAWCWHMGAAPNIFQGLWLALGALAVFGALVFSYLNFSWFRMTPPDFSFVLLILITPTDMVQMIVVLMALILSILLVKMRPQWVRALIPADERERLTSQMEEALDLDSGHMEKNGWYPVGPIAMLCVLAGYCANVLM